LVVTEIERQFLDLSVISPVGTLNEMWRLIDKMHTGVSVRKCGVYWRLRTKMWITLASRCENVEYTGVSIRKCGVYCGLRRKMWSILASPYENMEYTGFSVRKFGVYWRFDTKILSILASR
jgi:hypothetical protein